MKAHKYWSIGAVITMFGTFCTGYKGSKTAHKYLALSSLICMVMESGLSRGDYPNYIFFECVNYPLSICSDGRQ